MKLSFFFLGFCCFLQMVDAQTPAEVTDLKSKITAVTVFKQGAQVTRTATINRDKGTTIYKFTGISSKIDAESIQLKTNEGLNVRSITNQLNYFEPPQVKAVIANLELLKDSLLLALELNKSELVVLAQEEKMILANQTIGGTQSGVDIENLKATADFYQQRLTAISKSKLLIKRENRLINEKFMQVSQQIMEMNANEKSIATTEILVKVEAEEQGMAEFELGYFVEDAKWVPTYDIKVEDVASPTQLIYKANITQNTEEDWTDVQLTLSTGEPTLSGQQPEIGTWRLGYYSPVARSQWRPSNTVTTPGTVTGIIVDEYGEPLIGANILVKGSSTGTVTDLDGRYSIQVPEGTTSLTISYTGYGPQEVAINSNVANATLVARAGLDEIVITGARMGSRSAARESERTASKKLKPSRPEPVAVQQNSNTTTHEFIISTPFTIPGDNKEYIVNINQHEVPTVYHHAAVPKLDKDAFLTAMLSDWEKYHLLSGAASLFFESTFVGNSFINVENTEDTLAISLGRDANVVIQRTKLEQLSSKAFVGNRKVEVIAWQIEIRNKKSELVTLTLEDQIPVSVMKEIDVKLLEQGGAQYNEATGILTWKMSLAPSQTKRLRFKYQVRYPGKRRVILE